MSGNSFRVYVPSPGSFLRSHCLPGSAVVGTPDGYGQVLVDFEGGKYTRDSVRYAEYVRLAWSRHAERYPTVARMWVPIGDLIEVGEFDPVFGEVLLDGDASRRELEQWVGHPVTDPDLQCLGVCEDLRMVRAWPQEKRVEIRFLPASVRRPYEEASLI